MKTSESLTKFAPAFIAAQKAMTHAVKDANNPHFKSKYADLPGVIEAVKDALNSNGISFTQSPSPSDGTILNLTTRLLHESGEWIEDTGSCPLPKADPQGFGSANTYLRRYCLAAICGIGQDDDDGNAGSYGQQPARQPQQQQAQRSNGNGSTPAQKAAATKQETEAQLRQHVKTFFSRISDPDVMTDWDTWMRDTVQTDNPDDMGPGQLGIVWNEIQRATTPAS